MENEKKSFTRTLKVISVILSVLSIFSLYPISIYPEDTKNEPQNADSAEPAASESLNTKTVNNADGTKTLEVYGEPVRYRDKDGAIKDISLEPQKTENGFSTGNHRIYAEFPEKIEDGVVLNTGEYNIIMMPIDEDMNPVFADSPYLTEKAIITYKHDEKTRYEYNLTYSGYKENIVVSEYTGQSVFFFRLLSDGLKVCCDSDEGGHTNILYLSDNNDTVVAYLSEIVVFTSDNRNNFYGSIEYDTVKEGQEYVIRIELPISYLSSPETQYPIYIDPSISVEYNSDDDSTWNDIEDITVNQNHATDSPTSGTLYVGKAGANYGAMRTVMRFPDLELYGIFPNNITEATIHVRDIMCYSFVLQVDCYGYYASLPTGNFSKTNITWNGINGAVQYYESSGAYKSTKFVSYSNGQANSFWYDFNILPIVKDWALGRNAGTLSRTDQAIVFKSTDAYEQSTNEQYVCFSSNNRSSHKPYLSITYTVQQQASISLNQNELHLLVGNGYRLIAQTVPAGQNVSWSSSDTSVATVDSYGWVRANTTGSTIISATAGDLSASCMITVEALDGVYRIQCMNDYLSESDTGYLMDNSTFPLLTSYNSQSRSQCWLIKNISGTSRYTLNPLSKTTKSYSGTNIGLCIGGEEQTPTPLLSTISNNNGIFEEGQWYITGDGNNGFILENYSDSEYCILKKAYYPTNVEMESVENLDDVEESEYRWMMSPVVNTSPITSMQFYDSSTSLYLGGDTNSIDLKELITFDSSNAPDYRVTFTKDVNDVINVSSQGIVTILNDGHATVNARIGDVYCNITIYVRLSSWTTLRLGCIRYQIWSTSRTEGDNRQTDKYLLSVIHENNVYYQYADEINYNSKAQSVVFSWDNSSNSYHLYFEGNESNRIYIKYNGIGNTGLYFDDDESAATDWYIESFDNNGQIKIYTTDDNEKIYLWFHSNGERFVALSAEGAEYILSCPIYATAVSFENADISFLGVDSPNEVDMDPHDRAKGWLETNYHIQKIPEAIDGGENRQTVNAYCGELNDSIVFEALENSRFIIVRGHGSAGVLYYTQTMDSTKTLTVDEIRSHSYENAEIVIFGSCKSAEDDQYGHNLVDDTHRNGARCVIGFTDDVNRSLFTAFQYRFFQEYAAYCSGRVNSGAIGDIAASVYADLLTNYTLYQIVTDSDNPLLPNIIYCKE